jgi:zinc protease
VPPQDDPWLYQGSDIPHDKEWSFGTLSNGLRWAVRANSVPPGQVSIRIRMDVGSLYEKPEEAGFAHLIEHLVFRQSKYLGQNEAIPTWQRLGATLGSDTNAETTTTQTVFKIDLPDATPQTLDESFKLLSGMMAAPNLSESDIRTEVPIVLAEKRERGGTQEHVLDALREMVAYGQPMADHATIGTVATLEGAHQDAVRAFHDRWYRPENAAIIVSGDIDPRLSAALIQKWFGDWQGTGSHTPAPDFGEPAAPIGGDPANPVTYARVLVEPSAPRALSMAVLRPWHEKQDTITYNQGLMIDQVAQAIINRRLEARARWCQLSHGLGQPAEREPQRGRDLCLDPAD